MFHERQPFEWNIIISSLRREISYTRTYMNSFKSNTVRISVRSEHKFHDRHTACNRGKHFHVLPNFQFRYCLPYRPDRKLISLHPRDSPTASFPETIGFLNLAHCVFHRGKPILGSALIPSLSLGELVETGQIGRSDGLAIESRGSSRCNGHRMKKVYNKKVSGKSSYNKLFSWSHFSSIIIPGIFLAVLHPPTLVPFQFSTSDLDESFRWPGFVLVVERSVRWTFLAKFSLWVISMSVLNFARDRIETV